VLAALFSARLKTGRWAAFAFVFLAAASHGLLDMLTNGGLGVAYLWPFSDHRFFLPEPFIQVAPLGLRRFMGPAGLAVAKSELLGVWLPAGGTLVLLVLARRWLGVLSRNCSGPKTGRH
jgi:inner membrane protein